MFRFDISSIPVTSTITSALLTLTVIGKHPTNPGGQIMYEGGDREWVEGTASESTQAGSCCWAYQKYNTLGWPTGYYHSSGASIGFDFWKPDTPPYPVDINVTAHAISQLAIADGDMLLLARYINESGGTPNNQYHASKEYSTPSFRPKLVIEYTVPGAETILDYGRGTFRSINRGVMRGI